MWPVNVGNHRESLAILALEKILSQLIFFQLSTRISPGSDLIFAPIVSYVFQHTLSNTLPRKIL
jgi:hypothetical protein